MHTLLRAAGSVAAPALALGLLIATPARADSVEGAIHTVSRHGDPHVWGNVNAINGRRNRRNRGQSALFRAGSALYLQSKIKSARAEARVTFVSAKVTKTIAPGRSPRR